ncbi:MAG: cyclic nucleotide-binding domain-containing protein [Myxococcota bacterium]
MDVRALKEKATQLFSKGKFAKAAEAYDEYCRADEKDLQARLRLGDAWVKAGKKDKAILAYTWAAEGFAREGFLPRAIAASKLVLEIDPAHTGVQKMLADLYAKKSARAAPSASMRAAPLPPLAGTGAADPRAIDLEAPKPPASAKPKAPAPSPMNRADALELEPFEIPGGDAHSSVGGMAATKGPSPLTRGDAIEIEVEPERSTSRQVPEAASIEIEFGGPVTGEVEIPLEAGPLADADQLPAELQVPVLQGSPIEAPPPVVAGTQLPPEPAPGSSDDATPVSALDAEASGLAPTSYELDVPAPSALTDEIPEEAPPPAPGSPPVDPPPPSAPVAAVKDAPPPAPREEPEDGLLRSPSPVPFAVPPAPPEVIPARPKSADAAAPPGLKPRKGDAAAPPSASPPSQSSPSGSRIWLPPGFGPVAASSPSGLTAAPTAPAARGDAPGASDLERSLQAFAQFDAGAPAPAAARPAAQGSAFTELDLDLEAGSLLHAVDAAAQRGLSERGAPPAPLVEEAMEAPEEPRLEAGDLPKIPLFSDLPADAFIALFEKCPLRRFKPGDRVIQQGSKGDAFYVICAGGVRVLRADGEAERELARLDEGAFFGEMALLSEAPRSASVEATHEDTQLLEISAGVLKELSANHPSVSAALKKFCRQRLLSNLMQSSALFRPFSKSDRRDLVQKFRAREVRRGETLIHEGKTSDGLYVVLSGEVDVRVKGRKVASLREGEVFGEMSLLTRSVATASVIAVRHTSVLRLPREDFDRLILSHPQILEHVAELTDERQKANAAAQMV